MGPWLLTLACLSGALSQDTSRVVDRGLEWVCGQREKNLKKPWRERTLVLYVLARASRLGLRAPPAGELTEELLAMKTDGSVYQDALEIMAGAELVSVKDLPLRKELEARLKLTADTLVRVAIREKGRVYWSYPAGRGDFSNTQFATLGLHALESSWVYKAPEGLWEGVFRSYIDFQEVGEKERRGPQISTGPSGTTADAPARGWGYSCLPGQKGSTGSMTASGVAGLLVAREHLIKRKVLSSKDMEASGKALIEGWAELGRCFDPADNPGGSKMWWSYYLASVERCASLHAVTHLGVCDWYVEGSRLLASRQRPKGTWYLEHSPMVDTAFSLLFLMRGTPPLDAGDTEGGNRYRVGGIREPD